MSGLSVYDHLKAAESVRKKKSEKQAKKWDAYWREKAKKASQKKKED
jgi:hypothetical protein